MVTAGTREVLFNLFEGLVKPNSKGELIPAVAERYQLSEDGRTYTFTLREGVKFHNGATVTAEDVVYSIERCADTSEGTPLVPAFSVIQEVKAVDERTVTITIAQRDLEFISYLTSAIIPKGYDDQATHPVGTGPFMYVSRSPQENFVIQRFDDYWGTPAYLDKVTYKIYESADALVTALKGKSIDLCAHLTSSQTAQLDSDFQILEGTMNLVQAVYLNNAVAPFDDQQVRQALCYAIDRQTIMDMIADGHGTALGSSIYPAFTKYFLPELVQKYPYDPAKAKELLAQAGYPNGFDMTISVPSNYQPHMDTAEVVAEQLRAVGLSLIHIFLDLPASGVVSSPSVSTASCRAGYSHPADSVPSVMSTTFRTGERSPSRSSTAGILRASSSSSRFLARTCPPHSTTTRQPPVR